MKSLNEIVAELRMVDDGGKPAYRIGRADKVEVSMPSGTPVCSYVVECVTIKELADWIEAAGARERGPCNAAAMRKALNEIDRVVWDKRRHTKEETEAHRLATEALSAPPRQCDVGTAHEQGVRCLATMRHWRKAYQGDALITAIMKWAQTPYEAEEGAADGNSK